MVNQYAAQVPASQRQKGDVKYQVEDEFNLNWLKIHDTVRKTKEDYLHSPSYAHPEGTDGFCMLLACTDVFNHKRRLHEFTCDVTDSLYFGKRFTDMYSFEHLKTTTFSSTDLLLNHVRDVGLPSTLRYNHAPLLEDGTRDLVGCPRLKIDGWKYMQNNFMAPDKENETKRWYDEICAELKTRGPIVAVFSVYKDYLKMSQDILYVPDKSLEYKYSLKTEKPLSHAVMLIGYGTAIDVKISIGTKTPYFIFQNNWGTYGNRMCRMPIEFFAGAYCPILKGQPDFVEYNDRYKVKKGSAVDNVKDHYRYELLWEPEIGQQ